MYKYAQTNIQLYNQLQDAGYSPNLLRDLVSTYNLASVLFSAQYRANGKPFVCHLVGMASILATHDAPSPVILAGLLHAAYSFGNFGSIWPKTTPNQRKLVRHIIGDDAENLIRGYTDFQWSAEAAKQLVQEIDILNEVKRAVAFMRIANELEEASSGDVLFEPEKRRAHKTLCLACCVPLAEALGKQDLAKEVDGVFQKISRCKVPDNLVSKRDSVYLEPPLSHRIRMGVLARKFLIRSYHLSTKWLLRSTQL